MVILHSYVSLPEGILVGSQNYSNICWMPVMLLDMFELSCRVSHYHARTIYDFCVNLL